MILNILGILAIVYVVGFFGVCTWAVWYYGRDLHREVTQHPAHRNGWDSFSVDMEASVPLEDVLVTGDDRRPLER